MADLQNLDRIRIPRYIGINTKDGETTRYQLHIFCDASIAAYGAVAYSRTLTSGNAGIKLLTSKTKVGPLPDKDISFARKELLGAELATDLVLRIVKAYDQIEWEVVFHTDSIIVLAWIKGEHHRWKPFVRNRTEMPIWLRVAPQR